MKKSIVFLKYGLNINLAKGGGFDVYALQGNWFLFSEPDSPLSSCTEGQELEDRMSRLKIKGIPIEDDLLLDWDIGFCSNDPAYLKYGKFEELILSTDPKNEYVTYEELYEV